MRILLADDHRILRQGLRALMEREPDLDVVGEAEDGRQALRLAVRIQPDIVVMDIGMRGLNGLEATRQIAHDCPGVRVVALSTYSDKRYVLAMLEAGARGYVLKSAAGEELVRALREVGRGRRFLSPDVTDAVVQSYLEGCAGSSSGGSGLTPREREVLQLVAEGKTTRQIAELLCVSLKTIETHRYQIMQKLDLHSVAELTRYAVREGLTFLQ